MKTYTKHKNNLGFTLIELLVAVAILAILIIIALSMLRSNRSKADDAKTKTTLNRLKIAFEDYYSDNNCYPPADFFDDASDCGSNELSPYLPSIPCDPTTGLPYVLETDDTGCQWFKLYTNLKTSKSDPEALAQCSSTGSTLGNYAVSSDNVLASVYCTDSSPTPSGNPAPPNSPLPSIDPSYNYYYCSAVHNCTAYDPLEYVCTPSYTNNANCDGGTTPCQSIGHCTLR